MNKTLKLSIIALSIIISLLILMFLPCIYAEECHVYRYERDGSSSIEGYRITRTDEVGLFGDHVTKGEILCVLTVIFESIGIIGLVLIFSNKILPLTKITLVFPMLAIIPFTIVSIMRFVGRVFDRSSLTVNDPYYTVVPYWGFYLMIILHIAVIITILYIFKTLKNNLMENRYE